MTLEFDNNTDGVPAQNSGQADPSPLPTKAASQAPSTNPPSITSDKITCKTERDWIDYVEFIMGIVGLAFLIAYTIFTAKMSCANKRAADVAHDTLGQIQQQTTLIRQQLVGSQAAILTFQPLIFNTPNNLSLSISNDGHVNALDVHVNVAATKKSISGRVLNTPKHYDIVIPVVKATVGWSGIWNMPWIFRQLGESGQWPAGWPGNETFEFKGTVVYNDGFGDIITVPLCQKWLPNFSIITINPLNGGKGSSGGGGFYPCIDFQGSINSVLQEEKRAEAINNGQAKQ